MQRLVCAFLLASVSVAVASCAATRSSADVKADEELIRKLNSDWIAAEASNSVDSALAFLWEDASMQPPDAAEIQGHAAIRAAYTTVRFISLTSGTTRVSVSAGGDLAAIWGPLKVVIEGPAGPITLDQKFVAVWQKRSGAWKVIENTWNANAPRPAG